MSVENMEKKVCMAQKKKATCHHDISLEESLVDLV